MKRYTLHPFLTYGVAEGEIVFLDVRHDCYFAIDPALSADLAELKRSGGMPTEEVAKRLLDADLVEANCQGRTAATTVAIPQKSLDLRPPPGSPKAADFFEVGFLNLAAVVRLRLDRLETILASLDGASVQSDDAALTEAARRFESVRRRLPWARRCLPDSLALAWYLQRRSLSAMLVLGVTPAPFAAHCWIQDGNHILNDDAGTVAAFTPVLALST